MSHTFVGYAHPCSFGQTRISLRDRGEVDRNRMLVFSGPIVLLEDPVTQEQVEITGLSLDRVRLAIALLDRELKDIFQ